MNKDLEFLVNKASVDRAGVAQVAYDFGRQDEQQRIIKLLTDGDAQFIVSDGFGLYVDKEALITLIKGENNE